MRFDCISIAFSWTFTRLWQYPLSPRQAFFVLSNIHLMVTYRKVQKDDINALFALPDLVLIPTRTLDSLMWGSYPASLRNVVGSTQVPVPAWNNARKGTWRFSPPVKLKRRHMTNTVSVWRKTQSNKQTCSGAYNTTKLYFNINNHNVSYLGCLI
jgi:hypothetical protein